MQEELSEIPSEKPNWLDLIILNSYTATVERRCIRINGRARKNITEEKAINLKQIEDEALHLSEEERAELAQKLLLGLDAPSIEEIEEDWLVEAHRRARELDEGTVQAIPAEEVRKKAKALLR